MSDARRSANRRLDQWLWFARLVKSRSLAARLCAAGMVAVNGTSVSKPSHAVRVGDAVAFVKGGFRRTVRVRDLGIRRGPAKEAGLLYEEAADRARLSTGEAPWTPLLQEGPAGR